MESSLMCPGGISVQVIYVMAGSLYVAFLEDGFIVDEQLIA